MQTRIDIPALIKYSKILSAYHLQQLTAEPLIPLIDPSFEDNTLKNIFQYYSLNLEEMENELHLHANDLFNEGKVKVAWQVLLALA